MKAYLRYFGALTLYFLVLFLAERLLFLAFAHRQLAGIPWPEVLASNRHGLPMDLSATGYILALPALLCIVLLFREVRMVRWIVVAYLALVVAVSVIVTVADIGLFQAWGTKLDRKALSYLAYPKEVMATMTPLRLASSLLFIVGGSWGAIIALRRIDHRRDLRQGALAGRIAAAVLVPALCVLAARGGPQDLPIDKSWSWYSRHPALNLAALNGLWNLMEIGVEPAELERNPYEAFPTAEAQRIFTTLHPKGHGPAERICTVDRPNVLLIMLESWSADIIEPLGGDSGVAPQFTRACRDGILFPNMRSTGFRTEQGLCALLSAFPSQPTTTIIRKFGKFDQLPSVVKELGAAGYGSRYYYAGDVDFANTRAYLAAMGFDVIHDEHSFPIERRTRWGAFDEELFAFHLRDASTAKEPFFQLIMTATSHEPFDAPVREGFDGMDEPSRYRNTIHYTDRCLGTFLDAAKQQPWYAHTLIVICADHGHYLPRNLQHHSEARHRIPFLITGGALRDDLRGTVNTTYGCHVDLAATLLGQLGLPHDRFAWSRDLYDPGVPHSAFWTYDDGFGIADSVQTIVFDETGQRVIELRDSTRTADEQRLLRDGKAQLQVLIDRYMAFDQ
ncbi:MAG: sulfatase-like hydrolase/transferase [Flavobacteriales bacterium]